MYILKFCPRLFFTQRVQMQFIEPAPLMIATLPEIPRLEANNSQQMLTHAWSQRPLSKEPLMAPIFSLQGSQYTGESIQLRGDIFNQAVRRDLIYRLYQWRINLNKIRTHRSRTMSEISGSGAKPRPQKGQGRARLGNVRAPGRKKGAKAHGPKPRIYSFHLNEKLKLKALKSLLSSKLTQGKIRIVDSEYIVEGRTKLLQRCLEKHLPANASICLITSSLVDANFELAQRNLKYLRWYTAQNVDILDVIKCDRLIITKEGLKELTLNIFKSEYVIYKKPYQNKIATEQQQEPQFSEKYDPSKPLQLKFRVLQEYLKLFEEAKLEKKEMLQQEMERVRKTTQYTLKKSK